MPPIETPNEALGVNGAIMTAGAANSRHNRLISVRGRTKMKLVVTTHHGLQSKQLVRRKNTDTQTAISPEATPNTVSTVELRKRPFRLRIKSFFVPSCVQGGIGYFCVMSVTVGFSK